MEIFLDYLSDELSNLIKNSAMQGKGQGLMIKVINKQKKKIKLLILKKSQRKLENIVILSLTGWRGPNSSRTTINRKKDFWSIMSAEELNSFFGYETICANWFATSKANKKLSNLTVAEYTKELELILRWIQKKYHSPEIWIETLSFASVPVMSTPFLDKYNVKKVACKGPIINDIFSSFKLFSKKPDSIVNTLIKKYHRYNRSLDELTKDYKNLVDYSFPEIKEDNVKKFLFLVGEFETKKRFLEAKNFSEMRGIDMKIIDEATHNLTDSWEIHNTVLGMEKNHFIK